MPFSDTSDSASSPLKANLSYRGELRRKALHLLALVVPGGMAIVGDPWAAWLLVPLALAAFTADAARARLSRFNRFIRWIFGSMMRPREAEPREGLVVNGATWVLISAALLALLFPVRLAAPIFAMFMVADAVAALIGRRYGRVTWARSSATVEGSIAFLFSAVGTLALISPVSFGLSVLAAGVATVTEALPLPVNDNLVVPIVTTGIVLAAETLVIGTPSPPEDVGIITQAAW